VLGRLTTEEAAVVKWWDIELCNRVTDWSVQPHGGYGYMREYAVGRGLGRQPRPVELRRHHRDHEGIIGRSL
jgi:alkylation response protein AidB-like acyl-CoA dehydrogenase